MRRLTWRHERFDLDRAAALVQQADLLLIAAGAGIGVDSGLPDFRGNEGFWQAYPALGRARMAFTSVASPSTFREDPALAWGFYGHRLNLYRATVPHDGFRLLKQWGERMKHGYGIFTSNVDGSFRQPVSISSASMNATVRSTTCNAFNHVAPISGAPTATRRTSTPTPASC